MYMIKCYYDIWPPSRRHIFLVSGDMGGAFAYGQKSVRTLLLVKQRKSDRKEKTA